MTPKPFPALKRAMRIAALGATTALSACGIVGGDRDYGYRNYTLPSQDPMSTQIDAVFACMKATGALANQGFAIAPFANDTGRQNNSGSNATGSFIPTGPNVAIYAVEAISRAGGIAYDYSNLDLVRNIAFTGGEAAARHLQSLQNQNMPSFGITVFATALDFGGTSGIDLRVGGFGPVTQRTSAHAYYAAHIVQPGSQRSLARGYALYNAHFDQAGFGVSRFVGGGDGTLVTGNAGIANQEPLQRPTAEGIMLSVAYALAEIPALSSCRNELLPFEQLEAEYVQANRPGSTDRTPGRSSEE